MARRKVAVSDQAIVDRYRDVGNAAKVAAMLGVCDKTVYDVLKNRGIDRDGLTRYREKARFFDSAEVRRVAKRYESGESAAGIAARYGCSTGTVLESLRRSGVAVRGKERLTSAEKASALALYCGGLSFRAVATRLQRSEATITRFIHDEHALTLRARYKRREDSPAWKGGRHIHHGYVYILSDDPIAEAMRDGRGYVLEHRFVIAKHLGRQLLPYETVHHIDGDKTNNHIGNLELRIGKHGKGVVMACGDCGSTHIKAKELGRSVM